MIHENIELTGSFVVSGSFVLPNHPNTGSVSALTGSVYHDTTDNILKVYTGNAWETVGAQTAPAPPGVDIEYLLVAGGGGAGGYDGSAYQIGDTGTDSSIAGATISTITANGGGRGAVWNQDGSQDGGSGGGASGNRDAGSGTVGQGNDGGTAPNGLQGGAGGGGGAGQTGSNGTTTKYGDGGDGLQSSITGTSTYYAGGGGAGGWNYPNTMTRGDGGQGGGGNGTVEVSDGNSANVGNPGTSNTGGGAGAGDYGVGANHGGGGAGGLLSSSLSAVTSGSSFTVTVGGGGAAGGTYGAAGGSGVAIFAYDSGSINGAGGIVGDAGNGRKYNQFNESGTFKVGSTSDFQIVTDSMTVHLDAGNYSSRGTSTWTDLSGDSNNATISGATLGQNWYYDFDGSNDYGTFNSGVTGAPLTYEVWLRPDVVNSYQYALMLGTAAGTGGGVISLSIHNANSTFYIYDGAGVHFWSNDSISASTWVHACVSVTGTTASRYLNGSLQGTSTVASLSLAEASDIGYYGYGPNYYLNGQIAQLRIYNKALSATEVLQNYQATKTNFV